ncbi:hypothetical protein [Nocardiopsis ansamitocini]|nr:hypothetical protein [Nocardiopsis ansamitocini]
MSVDVSVPPGPGRTRRHRRSSWATDHPRLKWAPPAAVATVTVLGMFWGLAALAGPSEPTGPAAPRAAGSAAPSASPSPSQRGEAQLSAILNQATAPVVTVVSAPLLLPPPEPSPEPSPSPADPSPGASPAPQPEQPSLPVIPDPDTAPAGSNDRLPESGPPGFDDPAPEIPD